MTAAQRLALPAAWLALIVLFGAIEPNTFLTSANAQNILGSQAVLVVLTMGLLIPLTAGDYDLSVAFTLDGNPKDQTYQGTPQPVDVGVPAYAFPSNDVYPSCDVKWVVRPVAHSNDQNEVVDVQFGDVLGGSLDPCTQAEAAAKLVAAKVPHQS